MLLLSRSHGFICTEKLLHSITSEAYCRTPHTCSLKVINPSEHSQNQSQLRDWITNGPSLDSTSDLSHIKANGERLRRMFSAADKLRKHSSERAEKTFTPHISCIIENQYFTPPRPCAAVWWPIWRKTSSLRQIGVPPNAILLPLNRLL